MRGYIEKLRTMTDGLPDMLLKIYENYRAQAFNLNSHARMASTIAFLKIGYEFSLKNTIFIMIIHYKSLHNLTINSNKILLHLYS